MKRLSLYLFLILFTLHTPSLADDIRDLQIEGMSIGDSLLDYYSKDKINNDFAITEYEIPEKNKYKRIYIETETFENFQYVSIDVKYDDLKYIIHGITGMDDFSDSKKCFEKQNKIIKDLSSMFNQKPKKYTRPSVYDETGESLLHNVDYYFNKGRVGIICYDYAEHTNITSGLDLTIRSKEFQDWLNS